MAVERREQIQMVRDEGYQRKQRVVEYAPSTRQIIVSRVSRLLWLIATFIIGLVTFRFMLLVLAANPQNDFVDLVYSITDSMVSPFVGIIAATTLDNGAIIEPASLFAGMVYAFVAAALVSLFRILFADTNRSRHVTVVEQED